MKEVVMYKCRDCGKSYDLERLALECEFNHAKERLANQYLQDGFNLNFINAMIGFNWNLSEEMKKITKDNCFIISHWQCCQKPAYQITQIDYHGNLYLWGIGSWNGGYGGWKNVNDYELKKIYPKEQLYKYTR